MEHNRNIRTCRGKNCGASIFFAKREDGSGKMLPMNATPDEAGEYVVTAAGIAHRLKANEEATGARYVCHFKTCAQADRFSASGTRT